MKAGGRNQVLGSTSCLVNVLGGRTCDAERVKDELQHIKHVFQQNEYVIVTSDESMSKQEPALENKGPTSICMVSYQQIISRKSVDFWESIIPGKFKME
jgi:3-phosphoglycerate kinase